MLKKLLLWCSIGAALGVALSLIEQTILETLCHALVYTTLGFLVISLLAGCVSLLGARNYINGLRDQFKLTGLGLQRMQKAQKSFRKEFWADSIVMVISFSFLVLLLHFHLYLNRFFIGSLGGIFLVLIWFSGEDLIKGCYRIFQKK